METGVMETMVTDVKETMVTDVKETDLKETMLMVTDLSVHPIVIREMEKYMVELFWQKSETNPSRWVQHIIIDYGMKYTSPAHMAEQTVCILKKLRPFKNLIFPNLFCKK